MSLNGLNWWFELTPLTFARSGPGSLRAEGFAESMNRWGCPEGAEPNGWERFLLASPAGGGTTATL